jgi:hypothetical protein
LERGATVDDGRARFEVHRGAIMRFLTIVLVVTLLIPFTCYSQTSGSNEPLPKLQPAPADCKRNQTWSQTEERCVTIITCEKTNKPWTLRCLADGEYKNTSLQGLYKRGFRLKEISGKGAYYFRDASL